MKDDSMKFLSPISSMYSVQLPYGKLPLPSNRETQRVLNQHDLQLRYY